MYSVQCATASWKLSSTCILFNIFFFRRFYVYAMSLNAAGVNTIAFYRPSRAISERFGLNIFKFEHSVAVAMMEARLENRVKIVTLLENADLSQTKIAECVGVTKSCVSKVAKEYRESGSYKLKYSNCGGRSKKLDRRDLRKIRIISGNKPRMTDRDVQSELGPRGDGISLRTVQRGLNEAGCVA